MPHVVIEYSKNLNDRMNIPDFVKCVHEAVRATGEFGDLAVHTRTSERSCYRLGDGDPSNAFIRIVMRIAPIRTPEHEARVHEKINTPICEFLAPVFASGPLSFAFEIQKRTADLCFNKMNWEEYAKARRAKASQP